MKELNFKPVNSGNENIVPTLINLLLIYFVYKIFTMFTGLFSKDKGEQLGETIQTREYTSPNFWQKAPPSGYETPLLTVAKTDALNTRIYESHGVFDDNEEEMQGALKQLQFKTQYSWLAYKFYLKYGQDLTGFLLNYFDSDELLPVWSHIESLPTYRKKK